MRQTNGCKDKRLRQNAPMHRILACVLSFLVLAAGTLAGCSRAEKNEKGGQAEPTATPVVSAITETRAAQITPVSDKLIGFVVPNAKEENVRTALHGFLRTAENLGYPAKLYYADMGTAAVAAVEKAAEEGCYGLLIWNAGGLNDAAAARAGELSIPVVVPYHNANDAAGVTANVVADVLGYAEEVALGVAERMVERECKAGKILVYGSDPAGIYQGFVEAITAYYPQYNVGAFTKMAAGEEAAIEELANHILENRDIKGLFCVDADGAKVAVRAREKAIKDFKASSSSKATSTPKTTAAPSSTPSQETSPSPVPGPGGTPVPEGLLKSITISVAGYGISDDTIALMRNNDIYAFVLEPYYEASAQSVMLLDRILRGESVPRAARLNMPIVRMESLDKYVLVREQSAAWFQ